MKTQVLCAVLVFGLFGCGTNPSMSTASMEDESELATTTDALTSNRADVWWPMKPGNSWTMKSTTTGAVRVVSLDAVADGMAWMDGVIADGAWVGTSSSAVNTLYAWSDASSSW